MALAPSATAVNLIRTRREIAATISAPVTWAMEISLAGIALNCESMMLRTHYVPVSLT
ncbi:MAG: hypothetical protein M3X11_12215 [Acidobacteriota bacterium]|nr:hypothetical protein [Acidobacteriota bacterium]